MPNRSAGGGRRAPAETVEAPPDGFRYVPDFLPDEESVELLERLDGVDFESVTIHGTAARRTVKHFGYGYDYESRAVEAGEPIPDWLAGLRTRCGDLVGVPADVLAEALLTRYPHGATIGWHRDAPTFGSPVVGVSLRSPCRMRFQRRASGRRFVYSVDLAPGSAYVLEGAARWSWQHSIPPAPDLRYSITFRALRG